MTAPLVFMDTETTGLSLDDDVWEFAAIRRDPDGTEREYHLFIQHDAGKCAQLPESFLDDHVSRFPGHEHAVTPKFATQQIWASTRGAHVVGAVPNFDTERLALLLRAHDVEPEWHYHLIDVENLAVGWINGVRMQAVNSGDLDSIDLSLWMPPWKSDDISKAAGVEPPGVGTRHTAMGDARWARAIYDRVMGGK